MKKMQIAVLLAISMIAGKSYGQGYLLNNSVPWWKFQGQAIVGTTNTCSLTLGTSGTLTVGYIVSGTNFVSLINTQNVTVVGTLTATTLSNTTAVIGTATMTTGSITRLLIDSIPYTSTAPIVSNGCVASVIVSNQVKAFTPLYATYSLLDSTTNAVSIVICTNMPVVTASTNLVVGTLPAAATNVVVGRVHTLTP